MPEEVKLLRMKSVSISGPHGGRSSTVCLDLIADAEQFTPTEVKLKFKNGDTMVVFGRAWEFLGDCQPPAEAATPRRRRRR